MMLQVDANALSNAVTMGKLIPAGFLLKRFSPALGKLANTKVLKTAGNGFNITVRQGPDERLVFRQAIGVDKGMPIRALFEIHPSEKATIMIQGITFSPVAINIRAYNYYTPEMLGE